MKTGDLEKLLSNLVKWIITVCNRSLSNIRCACWRTNLYFHVLLNTGKQTNQPSKNMFQLLVQFLPSAGILLCFSQKKTLVFQFDYHVPMKMPLKQLLWPKICLFHRNSVMLPKMLFYLFVRHGFLKLHIAQPCSSFK